MSDQGFRYLFQYKISFVFNETLVEANGLGRIYKGV